MAQVRGLKAVLRLQGCSLFAVTAEGARGRTRTARGGLPFGAVRTIVVAAAVIVEKGRVLLTQRKVGAHLAGAWEFPGGKVEEGEDPRDALRRELGEELGVEATVGEILDVTFHRYDDADKAVLLLFFEAARTASSPAPRAIDVAAFEWAGEGALDPARFPPADVAVLKKVLLRL
jgi:8-oxo-dGTP diphosphatase